MRKKLKQLQDTYVALQDKHLRTAQKLGKKPHIAIPIATCAVLMVLVIIGLVITSGGKPTFKPNDSNVVVLNYDKQEQTIPTRAKNVGDLIKRLGIKLNTGDVVEPSKDTEIIGDNFRVNIYRAVPVTVVDGDKKTFTYSAAATPRSIVKQAGVEAYPEDKLTLLPTENFLTDASIGERVVIDRATPVSVNLYGTQVAMRTHAKTVGDLLKEKKIKLGKDDDIQPSQKTPIAAAAQIFLVRKGTQIQSVTESIPAPQESIEDASLSFGTSAVRQQGAAGERIITYQVQLQNGVEVGRTAIQNVVTKEPVTEIVAHGKAFNPSADKAAVMAAAGIAKSDYPYVDYIVSRESGWCYTKWQGEYGGCPAYHGTPTSSSVGYGFCQATPGYKMASAGSDWGNNPVTQLRWCDGYAKGRNFGSYGKGWYAAYRYWQDNSHW